MRPPEASTRGDTLRRSGAAEAADVRLKDAAATLGVELTARQVDQLLAYVAVLAKWNRTHNLTAVRGAEDMLVLHVLDSLAVVPPLQRWARGRRLRVLDVGSGAGLPGVVLATVLGEQGVDVCCVDAVAKKMGFVRQAAAELALKNLRAEHARIEALLAGDFDVVTSRAFAALPDFVQLTKQHLAAGGVWMAMKGKHPADELAALPASVDVFHVEQLQVPLLDAERCLIWMQPARA